MDLVEFLAARLDEDEAGAAEMTENAKWLADCGGPHGHEVVTKNIAINPARVLAEVEAKRRIIADRQRIDRSANDDDWSSGYSDANYDALQAIALPYADHPDHREEWKP